ncbi:MAG TPA: DUF1707 domain-containing protein [Longimicrobiales bacterium]|nr:DUF1707 domain-containing protein [Longimicrobiales bacterium]
MPDADAPPPARTLPLQRDRVIQTLSRGFAEDALTLEEFERRLDLAVRAGSTAELDALVTDLAPPPGAELERRPAAAPVRAPEEGGGRQHVVAIMSGNTRAGAWQPRRRIFAYAFWGGAELDFREAALLPGVTEVVAIGIMGAVDIIVPPGVGVEVDGFALMGGLDHVRQAPPPDAGGDPPRIRIRGYAVMGGVAVDVRYPGESAREARRRRRAEEKERRLERRRQR